MLFDQEVGRSAAGYRAAEFKSVSHPSGVFFEDFSNGHAHRQLPGAGPFDLSAHAINLRPAIVGAAQSFEPIGPVVDDVRDIAQGLDVIDYGRLAPEAAHLRVRRFGSRRGAPAFERVE